MKNRQSRNLVHSVFCRFLVRPKNVWIFFWRIFLLNPFRNFLTGPEYRNWKFFKKGPVCPTLIRIMKESLYKNGIDTKNKCLKWTWLEIIRKRLWYTKMLKYYENVKTLLRITELYSTRYPKILVLYLQQGRVQWMKKLKSWTKSIS